MKCNYDMADKQKYNDNTMDVKSRRIFEEHLKECVECRNFVEKDEVLICFMKAEVTVGPVPVDMIMSKIDHQRYKENKILYKLAGFLRRLIPSKKVFIPLSAAIVAFMIVLNNPAMSESLIQGISNLFDKGEIDTSDRVVEMSIQEVDKSAVQKTGEALTKELNEEGMGVSPWLIAYSNKSKVFFWNHASLVCYNEGYVHRVAYLKEMGVGNVQGSVVTSFNFNAEGRYVAIGNRANEPDMIEGYKSNMYMLNTETGKYFVIGVANMENISDCWSLNGDYYVYTDRLQNKEVSLYDTRQKKLFQIKLPDIRAHKVFVSNEGMLSVYSKIERCIYFINKDSGEVMNKTSIDFEPLYINGDRKSVIGLNKNTIFESKVEDGTIQIVKTLYEGDFENSVSLKENRYIALVDKIGKIGVLDLKKASFKLFDTPEVILLPYTPVIKISPEGERILYGDGDVYYANKEERGKVDTQAFKTYTSDWLDENKIVCIQNGDEDTPVGNIKAGDFNVIEHDVNTKVSIIIYGAIPSDTTTRPPVNHK